MEEGVEPVEGPSSDWDAGGHQWELQTNFIFRSMPPKFAELCTRCGERRLVSLKIFWP
jgi:hypothetical protein